MKVYSWSNRRKLKGEVNTLPSMTDQLADEPIQSIIERFQRAGVPISVPPDNGGIEVKSVEDLDKAFNEPVVSSMDKVEQLDALATAQRLVEQLRKSSNNASKSAPVDVSSSVPGVQTSDVKNQQDKPDLA